MQIDPNFCALRLPHEVTCDLFQPRAVRRQTLFRLLVEDGSYIRSVEDGREQPVSLYTWEEAMRAAEEHDAAFIVSFKEARVLCSMPVKLGKKPCWVPVLVLPSPAFIRMCSVYGRTEEQEA